MADQAWVSRTLGDLDSADELYKAVELAGDRFGETELKVRALLGMGVTARVRGNYPKARDAFREGLARAQNVGLSELESVAHQGLRIAAITAGDSDTALVHGWAAYGLAQGNTDREAELLINVSHVSMVAGYPGQRCEDFSHRSFGPSAALSLAVARRRCGCVGTSRQLPARHRGRARAEDSLFPLHCRTRAPARSVRCLKRSNPSATPRAPRVQAPGACAGSEERVLRNRAGDGAEGSSGCAAVTVRRPVDDRVDQVIESLEALETELSRKRSRLHLRVDIGPARRTTASCSGLRCALRGAVGSVTELEQAVMGHREEENSVADRAGHVSLRRGWGLARYIYHLVCPRPTSYGQCPYAM